MHPNAMTPERFWSKVGIRGPDECWPWKGCLRETTRGQCGKGVVGYQRKKMMTHRLAYILTKGPIPDGLQVNHTCDFGACCNPAHLYAGTQAQNMADAVTRGRIARGVNLPSSKLTEAQVIAIRRDNRGPYILARVYGVTGQNILAIKQRKIWKHI